LPLSAKKDPRGVAAVAAPRLFFPDRGQTRLAFTSYGFIEKREKNTLSHIDKALKRAEEILEGR